MPHGPQRDHFFQSLPFFATYTTDWFVDFSVPHPVSFAFAWSLAVEEQFYLLWPWVLRARHAWASWAWPVGVSLALLGLDLGVEHGLFLELFPIGSLARRVAMSLSSPICMGALLALALHSRRGFAVSWAVLGSRPSAALLFAALTACVILEGVPLWFTQGALTLVVGACAIRPDHSLAWLMDASPLRWLGTVSYGIYLFHVALITGARRVLPPELTSPGWVLAIVLPVTVGVASASYVFVERPLLRRSPGARAPNP
jgi:peptidoglycan/LPS O-acetylase OafA/YrhL